MIAGVGRAPIIEVEPISLADDELLARLFRTLGEASRLRILEVLMISERATGSTELHQAEIVRSVGLSQSRVSEHLACLVWCGFVSARIEGRRTYYKVADPMVYRLVDLARKLLESNEAGIASCRRIDNAAEGIS